MKIKRNSNYSQVTLTMVKCGDFFIHNGELYLKTSPTQAFNCEDDTQYFFNDKNLMVRRADFKLVEVTPYDED